MAFCLSLSLFHSLIWSDPFHWVHIFYNTHIRCVFGLVCIFVFRLYIQKWFECGTAAFIVCLPHEKSHSIDSLKMSDDGQTQSEYHFFFIAIIAFRFIVRYCCLFYMLLQRYAFAVAKIYRIITIKQSSLSERAHTRDSNEEEEEEKYRTRGCPSQATTITTDT